MIFFAKLKLALQIRYIKMWDTPISYIVQRAVEHVVSLSTGCETNGFRYIRIRPSLRRVICRPKRNINLYPEP